MKFSSIVMIVMGFILLGCEEEVPKKEVVSQQVEIEPLKIGTQIWASKSLAIPTATSKCYENCEEIGRFYKWHEAMRLAESIEGWRMPTYEDWRTLELFLGEPDKHPDEMNRKGGDKLKALGFNTFPEEKFISGKAKMSCYFTSRGTRDSSRVFIRCLFKSGRKENLIYDCVTDTAAYNLIRLIKE